MKTTAVANSNIAIIKYWGKRDEQLILPTNSSISFTMDEQLSTTTTVEFSGEYNGDLVFIDHQKATIKEANRVSSFLDLIRANANIKQHAKVYSLNTFPKAAGLASSASGFAALAGAATRSAGLTLSPKELSIFARRGSGSATRSVLGGAVEWLKGEKADGSDSYAVQLSPVGKWPHLRNVIGIIDAGEKKVSSRSGMAETVRTSTLYQERLVSVEQRLEFVRNALDSVNFEAMAGIIMQESNNLHATMLDTFPPIMYLNNTSREIMHKIHELNHSKGKAVAAYTFDAGPNANIYTTVDNAEEVKKLLKETESVRKIIECKVGEGLRFSDNHLF